MSGKDYGDSLDLRACSYGPKTRKQCLGENEVVSFSYFSNLSLICYIVG